MERTVLAVDIGASSGRVMKSSLKDQRIEIEEVHRFENKMEYQNGKHFWDIEKIFAEVKEGIRKASDYKPESIGIDTWGVDFVLLDEKKKMIGLPVAYRDERTKGKMAEFFQVFSKEKIYEKTGIQFLEFNTIYQLYSMYKNSIKELQSAKHFMFIPDYLNYLLSGEISNEYTNSTTSQMLNLENGNWDKDIIEKLEISHLFEKKPILPGEILGKIKAQLREELKIGDMKVIVPPTHDTASAIAAVPADNSVNWAYISSGTWSLMGIEGESINSKKALEYNFTNEGGVENRTRILKNIMGLWIIQNVKKEFLDKYSFAQIVEEAKKNRGFTSVVNPNDERFFNPSSMLQEIADYCSETGQKVPENIGEYAQCVFQSLAASYKQTLLEIEEISGKKIERIYIIGGGAQNEYLNELCAQYCGIEVYAGPIEATALGNLITQYIALGAVKDVEEGRKIIGNSFPIKKYKN